MTGPHLDASPLSPDPLTVTDLRKELDFRGVKYSGRDGRSVLVKRLKGCLSSPSSPLERFTDHKANKAADKKFTLAEVERNLGQELSLRLKGLETTLSKETEGLKSIFFNYTWGPKDNIHECYHKIFVEYGYRPCYSLYDAFTSLFGIHNETMNIWSHLVGFICAFIAVLNFGVELYNYDKQTFTVERILLAAYIFCASVCLLFSTIYHWFQCMSPQASHSLLRMDLTGIALLIGSSYFPGTYFGFYCHPTLQTLYVGQSFIVLALGLVAPWTEATVGGVPLRTILMVFLVVVGIIPFVHWLIITPQFYVSHIVYGTFRSCRDIAHLHPFCRILMVVSMVRLGFWLLWVQSS
jgi:predicted membrane channel-forming protein YqfA (hemolysin III family)